MITNALTKLLIDTIKAGLTSYSITAGVASSYQPTTQGRQDGPMVYIFSKGPATRYGWIARNDKWDPDFVNPSPADPGNMIHTEGQLLESTFQITAFYPQDPKVADPTTVLTATDLAQAVASILQGDAGLAALKAQSVGILRVRGITPSFAKDDRDQFENASNFDFTVTHESEIVSTNPVIETFEFQLKRV